MTVIDAAKQWNVRALREAVLEKGGSAVGISDVMWVRVLEVCGDVDLAATAVTMGDRPAWVAQIIPDGRGRAR